jgi:2-hydroxy-6-oxonona-2,4-dienedioate hydrolase
MWERRTVNLQGQQLSWFEAGSGPIPIVLLHGGGGTGKAWAWQLNGLSLAPYTVYAPDMPGFGRSDWWPNITRVDHIAPVIQQWMDQLGLVRAVVGGNSMGGRVALSLAAETPQRVLALVLLDAVGVHLPDVAIVNPLTLPPSQFMSGLVYDPAGFKTRTPYRTLDDAHELSRGRQSYARYLAVEGIDDNLPQDLSRVSMPVLLIWGKDDRIVPLAYGRALKDRLPHAELVVIDDCGHLPHIEEPELTNTTILNFLQRHLPTA